MNEIMDDWKLNRYKETIYYKRYSDKKIRICKCECFRILINNFLFIKEDK